MHAAVECTDTRVYIHIAKFVRCTFQVFRIFAIFASVCDLLVTEGSVLKSPAVTMDSCICPCSYVKVYIIFGGHVIQCKEAHNYSIFLVSWTCHCKQCMVGFSLLFLLLTTPPSLLTPPLSPPPPSPSLLLSVF